MTPLPASRVARTLKKPEERERMMRKRGMKKRKKRRKKEKRMRRKMMMMKITETVHGATATRLPDVCPAVWGRWDEGAQGVPPCTRTAPPPPSATSPSTWTRAASLPRRSHAHRPPRCPVLPPAPTQSTGEEPEGASEGGGRTAGTQRWAATPVAGAAPPAQSVGGSTEPGWGAEEEEVDTSLF